MGSERTRMMTSSTCRTPVAWLCLPLTLTLVLLTFGTQLQPIAAEDNCQLIPVRESIIKEMTLSHSSRNLHVSCTEDVDLHKCEGQCESKVIPSVTRHRGFRRDCKCCKETAEQTRTVVLTRCYHDGELIEGLQGTTQVKDLLSCGCSPCTN